MLHFDSDYMEGAHPDILKKLWESNLEQTSGYAADPYSASAKAKIRLACACPDAQVHFLVGGTQTNATVIKSLLRHYEGVIATDTGHITQHEAGAIEAGGHKVLTVPHCQGKLSAEQVEVYMTDFNRNDSRAHCVKPGMVYISHPTEYGTLYTAKELRELQRVCQRYGLPLFLDGARLGYGLMANDTDVTLATVAQTCDVFYIGGTKVGALFGEAVVMTRPNLVDHFFTLMKQQGALLAKGRILGIQFDTLFSENRYMTIARHAIVMANKLKAGLAAKGYRFYIDSPTNQLFVILDHAQLQHVLTIATVGLWQTLDDHHTVVRFATSWATQEADIDQLLAQL